jgi:AcrR family transcriptional regulator
MRHQRAGKSNVTAKSRGKDPGDRAAALSEKLTRKAAKIEQIVEKHQEAAAKVVAKYEALERTAEQLVALDIWTRKAPAARRPRFTREEIAATAMRIADTEGFDAVSMRRIAAELGSGTMTLYHYVRTKDELLSLVYDALMGEVVLPSGESFPDDWRGAVTTIAQRTRAALLRHPWVFDITDDPPVGPNSVRHFDESLGAVAALPISLRDKFDIISAVDAYVFGYCLHERNYTQHEGDPFDEQMVSYVDELVETGEFPNIAALAEPDGLDEAWAQMARYYGEHDRFERGLERLLDGFGAALGLTK